MLGNRNRGRLARLAGILVAGAGLALAGAGPALAADTDTWPLHQDTPITAAGFSEHGECPGISPTEDGWHFVLPRKDAHFIKLYVTFDPGGTQTVTEFEGPRGMHAYVGSAPGATLVEAHALVGIDEGKKKAGKANRDWFNLSHTCPATDTSTATPTPTETPTETPTRTATPSPTAPQPTGGSIPSPSGSTAPSPTATSSIPAAPAPQPVTGNFPVTG